MTGIGGAGGVSYFSCMKEGTRGPHAKFQVSMSIRSETVVFYKILGVGGGGGEISNVVVSNATRPEGTVCPGWKKPLILTNFHRLEVSFSN